MFGDSADKLKVCVQASRHWEFTFDVGESDAGLVGVKPHLPRVLR